MCYKSPLKFDTGKKYIYGISIYQNCCSYDLFLYVTKKKKRKKDYNSSVVIHHLVSDRLLSLISKENLHNVT
jgi:hypothetical protein